MAMAPLDRPKVLHGIGCRRLRPVVLTLLLVGLA